jgi:branched-subunit amino acid aminotransferase/4-amino-4-deoxychorismate lyase
VTSSSRRADPAKGVFETLLAVGGEPMELDAHLDRLAQSLESVYSQALPAHAVEELWLAAEKFDLGRLRLTAVPAEDGPRLDLLASGVESGAVFPDRGVKLRTLSVYGGLGPHKFLDRVDIDRPPPSEAGALIADGGELLEAGWANVFAVREATLWTPPLDGRLLPGTTRAALLELAAGAGIPSREAPLHPADLLAAEETFLSGSIRGIEAALELDGEPLPGCGPLSERLADALRRRWGLPSAADAPPALATAPPTDQPAR